MTSFCSTTTKRANISNIEGKQKNRVHFKSVNFSKSVTKAWAIQIPEGIHYRSKSFEKHKTQKGLRQTKPNRTKTHINTF